METAKQKAIREAYGEENWKIVKDYVNKEGELSVNKVKLIGNLPESFEVLNHKAVRPKSLKGIEDNNGWIRIESDLPKETECNFYDIVNNNYWTDMVDKYGNFNYETKATHYQPIQEPEPPIY